MAVITPIIVFAFFVGGWWLVARRLRSKGRGLFIRHLVGSCVGAFAMFTSVAIFIATGIIESEAAEKTTVNIEPEAVAVEPVVAIAPPVADPPAIASSTVVVATEPQKAPDLVPATEHDLGLTPTDFIGNMNISLPLAGLKAQLPQEPTIISGDVNDAYRGSINKNLQIMATISKASGNIKSVTLIAAGDGTPESGANIMLAGIAVYMAASDMATSEGKKPNTDLFMDLLNRAMETKDTASEVINNRKYSIAPMGDLGTWIGVEAVN